MKRWALVTVGLYGLLLFCLSFPGLMLAGLTYSAATGWTLDPTSLAVGQLFAHWGYWLWFTVLLVAQGALLLIPVRHEERRPVSRRSLAVPVVTASFLLANLLFAGIVALLAAVFGDQASALFEFPADLATQAARQISPVDALLVAWGIPASVRSEFFCMVAALGYLLLLWLAWGLIFFYFSQSDAPETLGQRATRWLLRGSILELLVAVPSHLIVRHRNDCCAPVATFWGIVTGVSVMLLAFGPGVFFLFARRIQARTPAARVDVPGPHR